MVAYHNEASLEDEPNEARMRPGELLREVTRMYTRAQRVVADCCRTTNTQCHLLTELARAGPLPLSELGTRVILEKSWVSRAVDAMVGRGLVTKEPNPADARSLIVTLTQDGLRTAEELNRTLDVHAESLLGSLDEQDRQAVEDALTLLMRLLREDSAANCCLPPTHRKESTC
jgi:DNA-binding MarR family transcriptional regulator